MSCEDKEIHVNDVGTLFRILITDDDGITYIDISSAIIKQLKFSKPDETVLEVDAEFLTNGADGYIIYTTIEDDLDIVGNWNVQAYIEFADGKKYHSSIKEFKVKENIV